MTDLRAAPTPLTEAETRAGLWAIRRVLDLARHAAGQADPADLADVLAAAGDLPDLMLRPAGFPDRFRTTLEGLACRHEGYAPVLAEFDRLTGRVRRRRPRHPDDDPWRDCGAGD
jgi:hypothetical protein